MVIHFRQVAKRSKTAIVLYNVYDNWFAKRRFTSGDIEATSGSTHTKFTVAESLDYLGQVFDDYLNYSGISMDILRMELLVIPRNYSAFMEPG